MRRFPRPLMGNSLNACACLHKPVYRSSAIDGAPHFGNQLGQRLRSVKAQPGAGQSQEPALMPGQIAALTAAILIM